LLTRTRQRPRMISKRTSMLADASSATPIRRVASQVSVVDNARAGPGPSTTAARRSRSPVASVQRSKEHAAASATRPSDEAFLGSVGGSPMALSAAPAARPVARVQDVPALWQPLVVKVEAPPTPCLPTVTNRTSTPPPSKSVELRRPLESVLPGWSLKAPVKQAKRPTESEQPAAKQVDKRPRVDDTQLAPAMTRVDSGPRPAEGRWAPPSGPRAMQQQYVEEARQYPHPQPSWQQTWTSTSQTVQFSRPPSYGHYPPMWDGHGPPLWDGYPSKGPLEPAPDRQESVYRS
jgi:hypothetical protein